MAVAAIETFGIRYRTFVGVDGLISRIAIKVDVCHLLRAGLRLISFNSLGRCGGCVMAGVFDLNRGAFDSSEAVRLHEAYDIALQGLRVSQKVDQDLILRLARSIVNVARTEADCLRFDGTIDPPRLAQRAILRMLQVRAPTSRTPATRTPAAPTPTRGGEPTARKVRGDGDAANSTANIMKHLFDRTVFAKL